MRNFLTATLTVLIVSLFSGAAWAQEEDEQKVVYKSR